jgi:hypothetical protein
MALVPTGFSAQHGGGYPAVKDLWATVLTAFAPRVGEAFESGRYKLKAIDDKAIVLERTATGSTVRVARVRIEKIYGRLLTGEAIKHREIDYTVAIEYGVLLALGNLVSDDGKLYTLAKRS